MSPDTEPKAPAAPPYISFKTLTNLLERLQETHLPPRIDRSYLDGLSGGYQTQVIAALRWLDLIGENGEVTGTLTGLATAAPEIRPQMIGEMLRGHYAPIFALSAKNATQGQLEEEFRKFGITGATLRKAIAFFLHAARYAEIPVSPHFKIPPVSSSSNGKSAARRTKGTGKGAASKEPPPLPPSPSAAADLRTRYIEMLLDKAQSQETMDSELLNRIETLLGYPSEDQK